MTCFWTGLIKALKSLTTHKNNPKSIVNAQDLMTFVKKKNCMTKSVKWNNEPISEQLMKENMDAINELDVAKINQGYDWSSCDPVLLLISEIFKINISHMHNGNKLSYVCNGAQHHITVYSNIGHFWA